MFYYYTVGNYATSEYVVERSRFLGYVKNVCSEEEAQQFVREIKAKHHDAKHNCFAYNLKDGKKRCSDDGEPSGTAGVPILDILERQGIKDTVIVVTRYFGGVLLGTGGLVRAYSTAAKLAVENAGVVKMCKARSYALTCSYSDYDRILRFLKDNKCTLTSSRFFEQVEISFCVLEEDCAGIEQRFSDFCAGKNECKYISDAFLPTVNM